MVSIPLHSSERAVNRAHKALSVASVLTGQDTRRERTAVLQLNMSLRYIGNHGGRIFTL